MRNCTFRRATWTLVVLALSLGFSACGSTDDGAELTGLWVAYGVVQDGVRPADGATNGMGGTTLWLDTDHTAVATNARFPDTPSEFTWERTGDTLVLTLGTQTQVMTIELAGDSLTLVQSMSGHVLVTEWQRYRGSGVLMGTWDVDSIVDDDTGDDLGFAPGDFAYRFDGAATVEALDGSTVVGDAQYRTTGAMLTIGPLDTPFEQEIFTVVNDTLYLFEYRSGSSSDQMLVKRFQRR